MVTRIALQIALFCLPFIIYGIYRYATRKLREEGKAWPVTALMVAGLLISGGVFIVLALSAPQNRGACYYAPTYINGQLQDAAFADPLATGECPPDPRQSN
jgi:multisubunit Na+/H+ antiporter MnhB subunit